MLVDFSKVKVLLVDDEAYAIKLMRMLLQDMGITQIFSASNGRDALNFLGECEDLVNLVLCDWNMPMMDGKTLLEQIRTVNPDLLFVMVTGRATVESVREARDLGVNAYIAKPFSPVQLEQKIIAMARLIEEQEAARDRPASNGARGGGRGGSSVGQGAGTVKADRRR
jgi:two-component system, chemotaxis family, chemotaxis protein CheY